MPLYIADYLADTAHLSATESGAYLHLIMHYWLNGSLPTEDSSLARIAKVHPPHWQKIRISLAPFFGNPKRGGLWIQKRVALEMRKSEEISNKRKAAALQMHIKSSASALQMHTQSQSQSHKSYKRENGDGRRVKSEGSPPHCATQKINGRAARVFIKIGTPEWDVYAAAYRKKHGRPATPSKQGGKWFDWG
jgi:uncharacterized protein YdaU (DUF1376 family)